MKKKNARLLSAHARTLEAFCIWIRRPRSVQPVNGFAVRFRSLKANSDQKKGSTRLKKRFSAKFPRANGLREVN